MESSLNTRAMLVSLSISVWTAARTDKAVTEQVAKDNHVSSRRAGHYRKNAIDVAVPSYQAVKTAAAALRERHTWHTLPWQQDGVRILPAAAFMAYSEDMRKARAVFAEAVSDFLADYPRLKNNAKVELNGLYNEGDYPTDITRKFAATTSIMPLPDAGDFRVKIGDDAAKEIKASIRQETDKAIAEAMREPYQRLHDHISRMVERLSDPEGIFRNTLVTGLGELVAVLPSLNLTGDKKLEELRRRAESMIVGITADDLREDKALRADVAKKATDIQEMMSAFMGSAE